MLSSCYSRKPDENQKHDPSYESQLVFPSHPERRVISTKKTTDDAGRYEDGYEDYSERMLHLLWSIIGAIVVVFLVRLVGG